MKLTTKWEPAWRPARKLAAYGGSGSEDPRTQRTGVERRHSLLQA